MMKHHACLVVAGGTAIASHLLFVTACKSPFDPAADFGPTLASLHDIETVRLEEKSKTEPETVEEAAEAALERMMQPPEPPERLELSVADVRAAALANNLDLRVQLVNPSIASATVDEEQAKFEATFFGSVRRTETDTPTEFETQSNQAEVDDFDLGFDIPLRTGGSITLDMPLGRSRTDNPFSVAPGASIYSASAQFSISHNLLRGAGIETNEYTIYVAQYERKITTAQTKLETIRILAEADRAYWRLFAARRDLEVALQQYELAMEQLRQAQRRVDAGESPEIEVTRAESGVAERLERIIVAETIVLRRQRDLKLIMNRPDLPMDSPTHLFAASEPNPLALELDPIELGEIAIANRMEMLELELQLALDRSTIDLRRNESLPLFVLDYTYSLNGLADSFGDAFDQIRRSQFDDWTFGVRAEVPIGNEAAKARVHRSILNRLQRLATRDQRKATIEKEVYDAVDLLEQNWQRILAARQAAILAGRTYEGEQRQFEVGVRTSTDVLDAAARLAEAQFREVQSLADYEIARVDIAFATGTLLGHGLVRWEQLGIEEDDHYFPRKRYGDEGYQQAKEAMRVNNKITQ